MAVFGLSFFSLVFLPLRHGEGMRTYRCRVTSSGDVHVCGVRKCASSTRQTGWWLAQRRSPALAEQRKVKVLPFIAKVGPASLSPRPFTRAGEGASSPVIPRGKPVCIQAAGSVAARVSVTLSLCPERADVRRPNDFRCLRPPFRSRRVGSVGGPLDHRAASVYVLARVVGSPVSRSGSSFLVTLSFTSPILYITHQVVQLLRKLWVRYPDAVSLETSRAFPLCWHNF